MSISSEFIIIMPKETPLYFVMKMTSFSGPFSVCLRILRQGINPHQYFKVFKMILIFLLYVFWSWSQRLFYQYFGHWRWAGKYWPKWLTIFSDKISVPGLKSKCMDRSISRDLIYACPKPFLTVTWYYWHWLSSYILGWVLC